MWQCWSQKKIPQNVIEKEKLRKVYLIFGVLIYSPTSLKRFNFWFVYCDLLQQHSFIHSWVTAESNSSQIIKLLSAGISDCRQSLLQPQHIRPAASQVLSPLWGIISILWRQRNVTSSRGGSWGAIYRFFSCPEPWGAGVRRRRVPHRRPGGTAYSGRRVRPSFCC